MTPILLTCISFDNGFLYFLGILHFLKYPNLFSSGSSAFEVFGYHTGGVKIDPITYTFFRHLFSLLLFTSLTKEKCESIYMQYQAKAARLLQQAKLFMKTLHNIILCPHWHFPHIQMQQNNPFLETILESNSCHVQKWKHSKGSRSHELVDDIEHLLLNHRN